jgi:hypothetical protein
MVRYLFTKKENKPNIMAANVHGNGSKALPQRYRQGTRGDALD